MIMIDKELIFSDEVTSKPTHRFYKNVLYANVFGSNVI